MPSGPLLAERTSSSQERCDGKGRRCAASPAELRHLLRYLINWQNLGIVLRQRRCWHLRHRGFDWVLYKRDAAVILDGPQASGAILPAATQHDTHYTSP